MNTDSIETVVSCIKSAMGRRQPVAFTYKEKDRIVVPYMLGRTQDRGLVLQGWQIGEGKDEGWRYFYLNDAGIIFEVYGYPHDFKLPDLKKGEDEYKAPAFVVEVLAVAP
jgi:hypothetical protein